METVQAGAFFDGSCLQQDLSCEFTELPIRRFCVRERGHENIADA